MKSKTTFNEEFKWLVKNMPEALYRHKNPRIDEVLSNHFGEYYSGHDAVTPDIYPMDDDYFTANWDDPQVFIEDNAKDGSESSFDSFIDSDKMSWEQIQNLIIHFGTDSFGLYLPMHAYFNNPYNNWGIYLFPEIIAPYALFLRKEMKTHLTEKEAFLLTSFCIYRHELFHFQTEWFTTAMEILNRNPYFLNYHSNIFNKYRHTEHWLEEALAEASVYNSRLVSNRTGINSKTKKELYSVHSSRMPAGYRDHKCSYYGGEKEAHKVLVSQILHGENSLPKPTSTLSIKSMNSISDLKVPLYFVTNVASKLKTEIYRFH
jgi:hypothetical protein